MRDRLKWDGEAMESMFQKLSDPWVCDPSEYRGVHGICEVWGSRPLPKVDDFILTYRNELGLGNTRYTPTNLQELTYANLATRSPWRSEIP